MYFRRSSTLWLIALLLQSGCAGQEKPAEKPAAAPNPAPPPAAPIAKTVEQEKLVEPPRAKPQVTEVTLISKGKPPFRKHLYTFAKKGEQQVEIITKVRIFAEINGREIPANKLPDARLVVKLVPMAPPEAEVMGYRFEVAASEPVSTPGVDPKVMELMRTELAASVGARGEIAVDSRGLVRDAEQEAPGANDVVRQDVTENIKSQIREFTAQLPEEAIGAGAKWRVKMALVNGPFTIFQEADYTLKQIAGGRLMLQTAIKQTAEPQNLEPNGRATASPTYLESYSGVGSSESSVDPATLIPRATIKLSSETKFTVTDKGQQHKVANRFDTDIAVRPK